MLFALALLLVTHHYDVICLTSAMCAHASGMYWHALANTIDLSLHKIK